MKKSPCSNCGKLLDGAVGAGAGDHAPSPGAITICLYCHHLMAFADDMSVRNLTDAEMKEVAGDSHLLKAMRMLGEFKEKVRNG